MPTRKKTVKASALVPAARPVPKKLSGITTLFFDIDDTLFDSTWFAEQARRSAVSAMIEAGMDVDFDYAYSRLLKIVLQHGSNYEHHLDDLCHELGFGHNAKLVAAGVAAYHDMKNAIRPYPEVPRALLSLRDKKVALFCATNGNALKQWDKLVRLGLHHYFYEVFVSDQVGCFKSEQFFKEVLKRSRVKPAEAIMVGDHPESDIAPAQAVGIRTVRVQRGKHAAEPSTADYTVKDLNELLALLE